MNVILQSRDLIFAVLGQSIVLLKPGLNLGLLIPSASQLPGISSPKAITYSRI